jgi:hypothetical protein
MQRLGTEAACKKRDGTTGPSYPLSTKRVFRDKTQFSDQLRIVAAPQVADLSGSCDNARRRIILSPCCDKIPSREGGYGALASAKWARSVKCPRRRRCERASDIIVCQRTQPPTEGAASGASTSTTRCLTGSPSPERRQRLDAPRSRVRKSPSTNSAPRARGPAEARQIGARGNNIYTYNIYKRSLCVNLKNRKISKFCSPHQPEAEAEENGGSVSVASVGGWSCVAGACQRPRVAQPRLRGFPRSGPRPAVDGGLGRPDKSGRRAPFHGASRGRV